MNQPAMALPVDRPTRSRVPLLALATAAPFVLAFSLPPSPVVFNELTALALWGAVVVCIGWSTQMRRIDWPAIAPAVAALGILAIAALAAAGLDPVQRGAALGFAGLVLAAASVIVAAATSAAGDGTAHAERMSVFHVAMLTAAVVNALIAVLQIFVPASAGGQWLAAADGARAVGNIRQANQLSTLLLFGVASLTALIDNKRLPMGWAWPAVSLLLVGVVLSGSRTGLLGIGLLVLWGLADRRLGGAARTLLIATPFVFGVAWAAVWAAASLLGLDLMAAQRLASAGGQSSATRLIIWQDAVQLIAAQPWAGVGFGEFNFALMLTPFASPLIESPTNAHNLVLHLAVEFGVPIALLTLTLLGLALWRGWKAARQASGAGAADARAAFVIVLLILIHSQLEYPLWYAFFLLPCAWALGACVAAPGRAGGRTPRPETLAERKPAARIGLTLAGLVMVCGSTLALADYLRVSSAFTDSRAPAASRFVDAQHSWLFARYADYAAAVTATHYDVAPLAFARAPHFVLDAQMLRAWSRALAQRGDMDRARFVAQRLKSLDAPESKAFFAPCDKPDATTKPYQCAAPSRPMSWADFR